MNYDGATYFEINKAVAENQGLAIDYNQYPQNQVCVWGDQFSNGVLESYTVDYCNNPSDSWPIITDHGIDICFLPVSNHWAATDSRDKEIYQLSSNPLRAAMIVYLKMKEQANAHIS